MNRSLFEPKNYSNFSILTLSVKAKKGDFKKTGFLS